MTLNILSTGTVIVFQISLKCSTYLKSNDPIIENIAVPNVTDNVLKSAYAGMVLRQVASHAFRRNCQDVIFLQRKLSLNIDRLVSKEHKIIEFQIGLSKIQICCIVQ